jgi:hypothetical protein
MSLPEDADASPPQRPFLPPPPNRLEGVDEKSPFRARTTQMVPTSAIHFVVHPGMTELQAHAAAQGWLGRGWTELSVPWLELRYTTDGWKTTQVLTSTDVPCPIVNGFFYLPRVPRGTEVEFALHVGLSCRAPSDQAGLRADGDVWLNNDGQNYRQIAR